MDFKIKLLTVGGKKLKLTIWDTGKLWQWSVLSLFNASNLKYRSYLSTCKEPWKLNYTIKRFSTFLSFFSLTVLYICYYITMCFGDLKLQEKNSSNKKPKSRKFLCWTKFTKDWFSPFDMTPLLEKCIIHSKSGVLLSVLLIQKSSIPLFSMLKFKTCRWCI